MGQPAIGACRTGRSTGERSELGGACRFAPVVSQRVRARWSGSRSYVVRRVLWYACRGGRTFTAAASKWPTICIVTDGTAVGRRLLRGPLRAQLLCISLAKNAVMMAPRAWRRCARSQGFQPSPRPFVVDASPLNRIHPCLSVSEAVSAEPLQHKESKKTPFGNNTEARET